MTHGILKGIHLKVHLEFDVQERIANILASYDDLIENNRRRMALLEESARLLYNEWFVRLRFPGYEHTRIVDGVPEGWERMPLENALVLQRGFDLPHAGKTGRNCADLWFHRHPRIPRQGKSLCSWSSYRPKRNLGGSAICFR
jgi:restriction endonuclease S subunit